MGAAGTPTFGVAGTGGGGGGPTLVDIPHEGVALTGSQPGTVFTIPDTIVTGTEAVYVDGLRLRRVGSSPGNNEYTISGSVVTTGFTVGASDFIWADYYTTTTGVTPHVGDTLSGSIPGTVFTFPQTPIAGTDAVYVDSLRLRRVASGPGNNEYTISGATITTGFTVLAGEHIWGDSFT